jgi:hypothetical protein
MMTGAQQLADRYVAVWNETDPAARRSAIEGLWPADGEHFVGAREVRGHEELVQRVAASHEKNVRDNGHVFRAVANARTLHDVVTFNWEMVHPSDGKVLAVGLEFLQVDPQGRIVRDYQFIVS